MKRPYIKPEMCEVRLIAEEAVFGSCKAQTFGSGRNANACWQTVVYQGQVNCNTLS